MKKWCGVSGKEMRGLRDDPGNSRSESQSEDRKKQDKKKKTIETGGVQKFIYIKFQ